MIQTIDRVRLQSMADAIPVDLYLEFQKALEHYYQLNDFKCGFRKPEAA